MPHFYFFIFSISAFASWALIRILLPFLSRFFLDVPNVRSSHFSPVPRGGGVSFVLVPTSFSIFLLSFFGDCPVSSIFLICLPLSIIGFLDDKFSLPSTFRFVVQFVTAFALVWLVGYSRIIPFLSSSYSFTLLLLFLLCISVVAFINFANFMDGVDGLVAGCMLVAFCASVVHLSCPLPIFSLIGSLIGFLVWNWSPSRVFMGDVGSTFLGSLYAGLVLLAGTFQDSLSLILITSPLWLDASLCLTRRLFAGQPIFEAHRLHLFQRLNQCGWSHRQVSCSYILATLFLSMAYVFGGFILLLLSSLFVLLIGLVLDTYIAVPFSRSSLP
jgi:Fuc2NAc and GlcNAc transferase